MNRFLTRRFAVVLIVIITASIALLIDKVNGVEYGGIVTTVLGYFTYKEFRGGNDKCDS